MGAWRFWASAASCGCRGWIEPNKGLEAVFSGSARQLAVDHA